jgi:hypothetical protein
MNRTYFVLMPVCALLTIFLCSVSASAEIERVFGRAYNQSGNLEYIEEHLVRFEKGAIVAIQTIYYDSNHQRIGEMISDFRPGPSYGSYNFKDDRQRYFDGVQVMSNRIQIYCKNAADREKKVKYLQHHSNQIIGQGFNRFIVAHLDTLFRGEQIAAKFVFPAKMDQYDIIIRKQHIVNNRMLVRIDLDSWFLRLFVPHLEAEYDLDSGRLLRYHGVSMISDASGNAVVVNIIYDYPQESILLSSRFRQVVSAVDQIKR